MMTTMRRSVFPRAALALAVSAFAGACASTGAIPRPFPVPGNQPTVRIQSPASPPEADAVDDPQLPVSVPQVSGVDGYALVGTALSLRGAPYRNGGTDPAGFDCSGFTQYVFSRYGIALPREVRDQFQQGKSVAEGELAAGDLLFFSTTAPGATHVGIAIGGDQFVHAPSSTGVVRVERLSAGYWAARYLGARRIDEAGQKNRPSP
jgi:cell wall-associated NlpC family hydrolase